MRVATFAALLLWSAPAFAQEPAPSPSPAPPVLLVGASAADVPSQRLAKHMVAELTRRAHAVVPEADAQRLLGRPPGDAFAECGGDELCYIALGQVVAATHVIAVTAAQVPDTTKYDCSFRLVDVRNAKGRPPFRFVTLATDQGLIAVARHVVEQMFPRPAMVAVGTPSPASSPAAVAAVSPAPTPIDAPLVLREDPPGTATAVPATRGRAGSRGRRPLVWSAVAAGALLLGAGAYFGADALQPEPEEKEGTSTMEVRF